MTTPPTYFTETRPEMAGYIPNQCSRLLEVGCGEGNFAAMIRSRTGCEAWGVELVPSSAAAAGQKLDRVLQGGLESVAAELPHAYFDVVVANDVLEHLMDPEHALRTFRQVLSPSGVVVASIPNVRYFENIWDLVVRGEWTYRDAGILDRTHVRFFTRKSIIAMFSSQGFRVETIEGINSVYSRRGFRALNRMLNVLSFNRLGDSRFLQFAVVARPLGEPRIEKGGF